MFSLTYTYDTDCNGVETYSKFYKDKNRAITEAKRVQEKFCNDFGMEDMFPHQWGDELDGEVYQNQYEFIDDCGDFLTEDSNANRLWIYIKEIKFED